MLVRFRQDAIDLQPKVIVILAGTNDIAGNTGPMRLEDIEANYASMAELARAHDIRVVFHPFCRCTTTRPSRRTSCPASAGENSGVESLVEGLLRGERLRLSRLFQRHGRRKRLTETGLADDGLHPNVAGYKLMAPLGPGGHRKSARRSHDPRF